MPARLNRLEIGQSQSNTEATNSEERSSTGLIRGKDVYSKALPTTTPTTATTTTTITTESTQNQSDSCTLDSPIVSITVVDPGESSSSLVPSEQGACTNLDDGPELRPNGNGAGSGGAQSLLVSLAQQNDQQQQAEQRVPRSVRFRSRVRISSGFPHHHHHNRHSTNGDGTSGGSHHASRQQQLSHDNHASNDDANDVIRGDGLGREDAGSTSSCSSLSAPLKFRRDSTSSSTFSSSGISMGEHVVYPGRMVVSGDNDNDEEVSSMMRKKRKPGMMLWMPLGQRMSALAAERKKRQGKRQLSSNQTRPPGPTPLPSVPPRGDSSERQGLLGDGSSRRGSLRRSSRLGRYSYPDYGTVSNEFIVGRRRRRRPRRFDEHDSRGLVVATADHHHRDREKRKHEMDLVFGKWPWRAGNPYWWWWYMEPILCCLCYDFEHEDDEVDYDDDDDDDTEDEDDEQNT